MTKKRDLEIIEHAINVSHTHGGSINLHKAFQFVHGLFSKKKSKPKESEPVYYGYDPKSTKAPPHESTYTKSLKNRKKHQNMKNPNKNIQNQNQNQKENINNHIQNIKNQNQKIRINPLLKLKQLGEIINF